jgi:hypothetical protein
MRRGALLAWGPGYGVDPSAVEGRRRELAGRYRALRLARGGRWCLGRLEGGGKQVAGRQAAVGPPFLGDGEDLLLGGEVAELIGDQDGFTERKVARQDDVFPAERK